MRTILASILTVVSFSVHAQGYLRFQMGAAGSNGPKEVYHFDRFPERFPVPTDFHGRFGGGWILEAEAGYRFSKNVEAGVNLVRHGDNFSAALNYAETDSAEDITMTRVAVLNAANRAGIFGYYYIGKKKTQPFVMGGIQLLVAPNFTKSYTIDTSNHGFSGKRRSVCYESYTGGLCLGYTIGGGIAVNRSGPLSFLVKCQYTFQSWMPTRMEHSFVFNEYQREEDLPKDNPGIKIPMNSFGITLGATWLFIKAQPVESAPQ